MLKKVIETDEELIFFGYKNMDKSIMFPISAQSGGYIVEDAVEAILIEKKKRIKPLWPPISCSMMESWLKFSTEMPSVVFFGI